MNYIILIIFLALFAFITYKNFKLGLALFVFLLPGYVVRFQFIGVPTTLLELCFLILFIIWLVKFRNIKPIKISWLVPIILFLMAATIGIFISPDRLSALGIWKAYFIEPVIFFCILAATLKSKNDWHKLFNALIFSGSVIALFAIYQKFTGAFIPEAWLDERRVTSIFGYPNAVGLYLAPIMIICFGFIIKTFQQKKKLVSSSYIIAFLISALAIFWSKTEAAWIAVGMGIFVFCLFKKQLRLPAIVIAVILIMIIGLTPTLQEQVMEKLLLQDWSGHVRKITWQESLEMLKNNFIFGAGLSGYPLAMVEFHKAQYLEIFQYPHNFILNFWSETGILGTLAWLWLIIIMFRAGIKNFKQTDLALAPVTFLVVILVHGLVDVPYLKNDLSMMFWLFAALAYWLYFKPIS